MPERIQRKRTKGWRMPMGAVNVTRPCDWSNPYRVGELIDLGHRSLYVSHLLAVVLFEELVFQKGWAGQIREELAGKDLVCWCPLDVPCHADVLLAIANGPD